MNNKIIKSIRKGISFLLSKQLNSGEFSTTRAKKISMENASYIKSIFLNTFVLHSLNQLKNVFSINETVQNATKFLLNEKEGEGFWRFFGKGTHLPLDLDDTCCALSALFINGVELEYKTIAGYLLNYRDKRGIFYTWILDRYLPKTSSYFENDIDWVVNANTLFFFSLIKIPIPEVTNHLCNIVEKKDFEDGSIYYYSPFSFIYCLSRAYADGGAIGLKPILGKIKSYLLNKQDTNGRWSGNILENAMATESLINCGYKGIVVDGAINNLLKAQKADGGWPNSAFFVGVPELFYGSRELTTAIAIEVLWKSSEL
jgi:hypothetical protein